jgi:O-antigen/teichoic acid export membrane protein
VGGLLFLLLWVTAEWLVVWLYGTAYAMTGYLLQILGLMIWVRCWIAVQTAVLAAVGWQRYRVKVQFVGVLVAVVLNLYVVTQTNWGLVGVAWVYVVGEVLLCLGYGWYLWQWRRLGGGRGGDDDV